MENYQEKYNDLLKYVSIVDRLIGLGRHTQLVIDNCNRPAVENGANYQYPDVQEYGNAVWEIKQHLKSYVTPVNGPTDVKVSAAAVLPQ